MKDVSEMNRAEAGRQRGMPLGTVNNVLAAMAVLISAFLLAATYRMSSGYQTLRNISDSYIVQLQNTGKLTAAIDYLSAQVRYFTITGDITYVDNYYEEYSSTRRRENAVENLREFLGGTTTMNHIDSAMVQSKSLCRRDFYAIRLVADAYGMDLSSLPEEVRAIELIPTDQALNSAQKVNQARTLVLGKEYVDLKTAVSREIQQCHIDIADQAKQQQAKAARQLNELLGAQQALIVLVILLVLGMVLMTSVFAIIPLVRGVQHIRAEQPIPASGSREFLFLAHAYNVIFEANRQKAEALAYEANHDKLTGLYNRTAYEYLLKTVDMETSALLLIDADRFKSVNDTYGHDVGDRVLKRIAHVLRENFRSDDYICRIGGDEFAAIMVRSGVQFTELIRGKITRINNTLQHPADGLPPISLSVGIAFGRCENSTGNLVKDADLALYQVKENGRCGCAFYQ